MTTSTLQLMDSLSEDLAALQIDESKITAFAEQIQGAPVSPIALSVLTDSGAVGVVRVRAFARVTTDLRKSI